MLCKKKNSLSKIFISNFTVIIMWLPQLGNVLGAILRLRNKIMQNYMKKFLSIQYDL